MFIDTAPKIDLIMLLKQKKHKLSKRQVKQLVAVPPKFQGLCHFLNVIKIIAICLKLKPQTIPYKEQKPLFP